MKNKNSPSVQQASFSWGAALFGILLGTLGGVAGTHYYLNQISVSEKLVLQQKIEQQGQQLQQLQLQHQTLLTQSSLDQATQRTLEQSLSQKQDEAAQLREQLAFYEHLLPLSGKGTVHIRGLDLEPQDDVVRYRLLLQRPAGLASFDGHMQFTAHGQQNGDSVTIVLNTAGTDPASTTAIHFDQFLRTTGLLQLPPDFEMDAITLHIYQGKQLRATHKIDLGAG
ncbi:MAG TPA: hypothetical protein GXX62_09435 [Alcaligenaceae bacterium]|nr:hypothetical protein [Alcaligenaceae bacterium]